MLVDTNIELLSRPPAPLITLSQVKYIKKMGLLISSELLAPISSAITCAARRVKLKKI